MKRILVCIGFTAALAYAACAHYPEGDGTPPNDGGGDCGACPDGWTCVDGACTAPPDGGPGGGSDGGMCTGSDCPTDGGMNGGDGGSGGGSDGGSGGTCGCDQDCGCGQTCVDHACVQTSCCSDTDCPDGKACHDGQCVCDGDGDDGQDGQCRAGKTLLCHYPPGNHHHRHNICVGDPAVPAHLAHGDTLGVCQ